MEDVRFVADVMVGKLAKWLRVLGYDTHYQPHYSPEVIEAFLGKGRILLTRHKERAEKLGGTVLIRGNKVSEQLMTLKRELHLEPARSVWFSRCLICNVILRQTREGVADDWIAVEGIPEYVLYQNRTNISFCPLCGRHFWPGSHRAGMEKQLEEWGFSLKHQGHVYADRTLDKGHPTTRMASNARRKITLEKTVTSFSLQLFVFLQFSSWLPAF